MAHRLVVDLLLMVAVLSVGSRDIVRGRCRLDDMLACMQHVVDSVGRNALNVLVNHLEQLG